jgi:hypothetical protein
MRHSFLVLGSIVLAVACGSASADSLYLTTMLPLQNVDGQPDLSTGYVFVAPYFARVGTQISVAIGKAASTGSSSSPSGKMGAWPEITQAQTGANGKITFAVKCDLTSVLSPDNPIIVAGVYPDDYNGTYSVEKVTPNTIVTTRQEKLKPGSGGNIVTANCPAPSGGGGSAVSVTITVSPAPITRAYIYLRRDALYSDTVNVTLGADGLLSSSDTASVQQITAILSEIAQTLGAAGFHITREGAPPPEEKDPRQICSTFLDKFVKPGTYYESFRPFERISKGGKQWRVGRPGKVGTDTVEIWLSVKPFVASRGQVELGPRRAAWSSPTGVSRNLQFSELQTGPFIAA